MGANVRRVAQGFALTLLALALAACAPTITPVKRVVLLAPFEGAVREIGYDMVYPLRLGLADANIGQIQLLSLDSGTASADARAHAEAFAKDPTVLLALVAGTQNVQPDLLAAFDDIPVIVIGHWGAAPQENVFIMESADAASQRTSPETDLYRAAALETPLTGGEIFGLKAYAKLAEETSGVTVITSAAPPSAEFTERLLASDLYVPQPGLLATMAYDAGLLAAHVLATSHNRADVLANLQSADISGFNGQIAFDANGYLADAQIYTYAYQDGVLILK